MSSSQLLTPGNTPSLVTYSGKLDLVEIRRNPKQFPRIKDTAAPLAIDRLTKMTYAAFLYRGQDTNESKVRFIAKALYEEIIADPKYGLPALSWQEIGMVIRNAVLGGGKEMFGVSVASLYAALIEYAKTEGHEAEKLASQSI